MQTIPDIALVPAGFRVKEPTLIQYLPRLAVLGSLAIAIIIPAVTNAEPRDHDFHFPIETGEQIPTVLTFYEPIREVLESVLLIMVAKIADIL